MEVVRMGNNAQCVECGRTFLQERDLQVCDKCIKNFDTDRLWKDHDENKVDVLDFNENVAFREKYRIKKKPLKVYVGHSDNVPVVACVTENHRRFCKEELDKVIRIVAEFAVDLRNKWDENDWFPCGFVNGHVEGDSELVKFIKKEGEKDEHGYIRYGILTLKKSYKTGYNLYIRLVGRDAVTAQCMRYNQRVCEKLQEELAFLYVRMSVETMVD